MTGKTLRLNMPQWQGGAEPAYHFGASLLSFLAPPANGPEETVSVVAPDLADALILERGIKGRSVLISQAKAAQAAIEKHAPDRIVTLGGDCLVSLAPMAYLNTRYGGNLGVLWVDSHPDVIGPDHFSHAHAHVLGMLLGVGDPEFDTLVEKKIDPNKVIYAGLNDWSEPEGNIIKSLGLRHATAEQLAENSDPIVDWIKAQGISHLAVHFDLDVLNPAHFSPLLFNNPTVAPDAFDGIPQGKMLLQQVVRLLTDLTPICDVVGLTIAEHLPWDMLRLRDALSALPLLRDQD